jgi:catechol 2,3-dioxygenase-like lactoylglutathione lyase family enzyme
MRLRLALVASLTVLISGTANAQLAAPGDSGVVMGHLHLFVRDMAGHQRFWAALGGTSLNNGNLQFIQFPGVFVMLRQAEPSAGTAGSTVNHFGFFVKDMEASLAKWRAAGLQMEPMTRPTQVYLTAPDGIRVEILEDKSIDVPIRMHHIHFYTTSPQETQAWYVKAFGAIAGRRGDFDTAELPGVTLIFSKSDSPLAPTKGRSLDHIGFEIRNLEQFVKNTEATGTKIDQPFRHLPNSDVTLAFVIDPWGTNIELNENLPPAGSPRIPWRAPGAQTASEAAPAFESVATIPAADTENLTETADGSIYVTTMDAKTVYRVTSDRRVEKFATLPSVAYVLGITNDGDSFALTATERTFRRSGVAGQPPQIDFSDAGSQVLLLDKTGKITATVPGPKGSFFNGITTAGTRRGVYLIADSNGDTIWQVDARAKHLEPWLKDPALAPNETVRIGANGIKVQNGWVYINSRGTMYRVRIGSDGKAKGGLTMLAQGIRTDDFAVADDGTIYLTSMTKISPAGQVSPFLERVPTGPAMIVSRDQRWLYWSTRGSDPQQRLLRVAIR